MGLFKLFILFIIIYVLFVTIPLYLKGIPGYKKMLLGIIPAFICVCAVVAPVKEQTLERDISSDLTYNPGGEIEYNKNQFSVYVSDKSVVVEQPFNYQNADAPYLRSRTMFGEVKEIKEIPSDKNKVVVYYGANSFGALVQPIRCEVYYIPR